MNDGQIQTIEQVREFIKGSEGIYFKGVKVREKYYWMEEVLIRFKYVRLKRAEKGMIRQYIHKVSGYSMSQISRLIAEYRQTGRLKKKEYRRHRFPRKYTQEGVRLLARTDELHDWLSGPATRKIMERESEVYGDAQFSNICRISVAHLYNLRRSKQYLEITRRFTKTKPVVSKIGERGRPDPNGRPGYIRIDTVHQGDINGQKGVYHINAVDEVVQWEIVLSVERIAENYLVPVLENMLGQFPFNIRGFHSDNGSEFVNQIVAKLLNKLLVRFTRSRPRHPDDNGLVETKNGSVIRKNLGYSYIPQACAEVLNWYHKEYLNLYINFHRPCFFPVTFIDDRGRIKKKYPYQKVRTSYEMLKSLPDVERDLRRGVTFEELDKIAAQLSDNQFAERMVKARSNLFKQISRFAKTVA
jgi:transposase InsO family protein